MTNKRPTEPQAHFLGRVIAGNPPGNSHFRWIIPHKTLCCLVNKG